MYAMATVRSFYIPENSQPVTAKRARENRTITVDFRDEATYFIPYQRRAQHAGQCGVEVDGGRVPTQDWMLNLQILTSGGFR
jgi:hypothetical protein